MENQNRNQYFDAVRVLCAVCVVAIHCINAVPSPFGSLIKPMMSIAVPFFFMLSGYYFGTMSPEKKHRQLRKICWMVLLTSTLYFMVRMGFRILQGEGAADYLTELSRWETWKLLLLWNESPFSGHLWYMHGLIYVFLIVMGADCLKGRRTLRFLIPVLLGLGLLFGRYSQVLLGTSFEKYLYRNYLFIGLPYFIIGDWLREKNFSVSPERLRLSAVVFLAGTYAEAFLLKQWDLYYISTSLLVTTLFLMAENSTRAPVAGISTLAKIGKQYCDKIYLLHPLILEVLLKLIPYGLRSKPVIASGLVLLLTVIVFLGAFFGSWLLRLVWETCFPGSCLKKTVQRR